MVKAMGLSFFCIAFTIFQTEAMISITLGQPSTQYAGFYQPVANANGNIKTPGGTTTVTTIQLTGTPTAVNPMTIQEFIQLAATPNVQIIAFDTEQNNMPEFLVDIKVVAGESDTFTCTRYIEKQMGTPYFFNRK